MREPLAVAQHPTVWVGSFAKPTNVWLAPTTRNADRGTCVKMELARQEPVVRTAIVPTVFFASNPNVSLAPTTPIVGLESFVSTKFASREIVAL